MTTAPIDRYVPASCRVKDDATGEKYYLPVVFIGGDMMRPLRMGCKRRRDAEGYAVAVVERWERVFG